MFEGIITFFYSVDWPSAVSGIVVGLLLTYVSDRAYLFFHRNKHLSQTQRKAPYLLLQQLEIKDLDFKGARIYHVYLSSAPDQPRKNFYVSEKLDSADSFKESKVLIYRLDNKSDTHGYSFVGFQCANGMFEETTISNNQINPQETLILVIKMESMHMFSDVVLESGDFLFLYDVRYNNETRNQAPEVKYRKNWRSAWKRVAKKNGKQVY